MAHKWIRRFIFDAWCSSTALRAPVSFFISSYTYFWTSMLTTFASHHSSNAVHAPRTVSTHWLLTRINHMFWDRSLYWCWWPTWNKSILTLLLALYWQPPCAATSFLLSRLLDFLYKPIQSHPDLLIGPIIAPPANYIWVHRRPPSWARWLVIETVLSHTDTHFYLEQSEHIPFNITHHTVHSRESSGYLGAYNSPSVGESERTTYKGHYKVSLVINPITAMNCLTTASFR